MLNGKISRITWGVAAAIILQCALALCSYVALNLWTPLSREINTVSDLVAEQRTLFLELRDGRMRLQRAAEDAASPAKIAAIQRMVRSKAERLTAVNASVVERSESVQAHPFWSILGGQDPTALDTRDAFSAYIAEIEAIASASPAEARAELTRMDGLAASALAAVQLVRDFDAKTRAYDGFSASSLEFVNRLILILQASAAAMAILVGVVVIRPRINDLRQAWSREQELKCEIERFAYRDPLTGLANRKGLEVELADKQAKGEGDFQFAYVLIDLNGFKPINDTFGHAAGDAALNEIAARLQNKTREKDIVARVGGDEFAILLSGLTDRDVAASRAENLASIFDAPFIWDSNELELSGSFGVAVSTDIDGGFEDVAAAADSVMFLGKGQGVVAINVYRPGGAIKKRDLRMRNELREALQRCWIEPHYQPKVDLTSRRIVGFEALARYEHPVRGMIEPPDFIADVEELGLLTEFDQHIVRRTFEQYRFWRASGFEDIDISINLFAKNLSSRAGIAVLKPIFIDNKDLLDGVVIEVTEDLFDARAYEAARAGIAELRALGVRISVDDLGAGYGSFRHLQDLQFNELKIDRSFVGGIGEAQSAEAFIDILITLAGGLDASIVAEGVETEEQEAFLRRAGCHLAHGYLYGRPVPALAATALLREHKERDKPPSSSVATLVPAETSPKSA